MTWQNALRDAITDPITLLDALQLSPESLPVDLEPGFRVRVPWSFVQRMHASPIDPLLRQVLSLDAERDVVPGFSVDPLEEHRGVLRGVLHKYRSRVLVVFRGGCAINCRYCFRRHFPYADNTFRMADLPELIHYLQCHPDVNEVILSGGDPLMADDEALAAFFEPLKSLPQLMRIRLHTRLPVVIPERITAGLCRLLGSSPIPVVVVLHINHANEIDAQLTAAIGQLRAHCHSVLNQSVILRGVNDRVETLVALSEALFRVGVQPYYLNVLDPVAGAAHFAVTEDAITSLYRGLLNALPGFLVPKLVQEQPGVGYKVPWMMPPA